MHFGGFGEEFGGNVGGFKQDLWSSLSMTRATKGNSRSTNQILRQMDASLEVSWACLAGSFAVRRAPRRLRRWSFLADSQVDSYFRFQVRVSSILERF